VLSHSLHLGRFSTLPASKEGPQCQAFAKCSPDFRPTLNPNLEGVQFLNHFPRNKMAGQLGSLANRSTAPATPHATTANAGLWPNFLFC
jgi:hypothetical protein